MEKLKVLIEKLLIKNNIKEFVSIWVGRDAEWETITEENGPRGIASGAKSAIVSLRDGNKKLHLFIKACEDGTSASFLNSTLGIFEREAFFYSEVLPKMLEFENTDKKFEISSLNLQHLLFKCFGCESIDKNAYIVLEKFLPSDYYITAADQFHTIPQILYCMKGVAVYHATSYCMKKRRKFQWNDHPLIVDTLFASSNEICEQYCVSNFLNNVKILRAVKEEILKRNCLVENSILSFDTLSTSLLDRLQKLSPFLKKILRNTINCSEELRVLTHGDFHMWNIAFSNKGKMDIKFFDFQLIRFTSGIIDVHHYLSQVATPATRNKHLHSFLKAYHDSFKETCLSFGLREEENAYTMKIINEEYMLRSPWGFFFGFIYILPRFVSKDFYSLLEDKRESGEIIELLLEKGTSNVWSILDMYVDMMQIEDDIGTIELMEKLAKSDP